MERSFFPLFGSIEISPPNSAWWTDSSGSWRLMVRVIGLPKGNLKDCHGNANWFWWKSKMNKLGSPCKETLGKVLIQACRLWTTHCETLGRMFLFPLFQYSFNRETGQTGEFHTFLLPLIGSNWGPKRFLFVGHEFQRHDLQVQNPRGGSVVEKNGLATPQCYPTNHLSHRQIMQGFWHGVMIVAGVVFSFTPRPGGCSRILAKQWVTGSSSKLCIGCTGVTWCDMHLHSFRLRSSRVPVEDLFNRLDNCFGKSYFLHKTGCFSHQSF